MSSLAFKQVDVFTDRPFFGNAVAVILGADGLDGDRMQRIAAWTNLPETTFVLQPSSDAADYRLRIFTPAGELPFAGHPTIGSAHAVLESGFAVPGPAGLRQECAAGVLPLTVEGSGPSRQIFVRAPATKIVRDCTALADTISAALGASVVANPAPMSIDVGPVWLVAYIEDTDEIRRLQPDMAAVTQLSRDLGLQGITVFSLDGEGGAAAHVRTFAPLAGTPEDPVCGSANATIAAYLAETGLIEETGSTYIVSQGTEVGRDGRIFVRIEDEGRSIVFGGCAVTVIDGQIEC
jgi:PhzF family phenazine biosynthesis protein